MPPLRRPRAGSALGNSIRRTTPMPMLTVHERSPYVGVPSDSRCRLRHLSRRVSALRGKDQRCRSRRVSSSSRWSNVLPCRGECGSPYLRDVTGWPVLAESDFGAVIGWLGQSCSPFYDHRGMLMPREPRQQTRGSGTVNGSKPAAEAGGCVCLFQGATHDTYTS
jgi:hypothetical protein